MIRTKQQSSISKIWHNINQSWGVAVGFLMLLFIIPFAIIVSDPGKSNLVNSNADSSKPLVSVSPQKGQGTKKQFVAEVRDSNVDQLDGVDIWFGVNPPDPSRNTGNFVTASFQNYTPGYFDWRSNVYTRRSDGLINNITSLKPDDSTNTQLYRVFSIPSQNPGEINLSLTDSNNASASVKFIKVEKYSQNILRFTIDVNFKSNFEDKNIGIYMKAKRALSYGGATSALTSSEWNPVGSWLVMDETAHSSVSSNQPPRFNSIPPSKAYIGQLYKYTISATDPEGDPLKYEITSNPVPSFLSLIGNVLSGTPQSSDKGSYPIVITITDSVGNTVSQSYTLTVGDVSQTTTPVAITETFTAPKTGDKISGISNLTWTISSTTGVSSYRLSYSPAGANNYKIISTPDVSSLSYNWDTTSITTGNYSLKLEALNSSGNVISTATSDNISVSNNTDTSTIQSPKLIGRTPEEGVITDTKPRIAATIESGSADADLSSLVVKLDGEDISNKIDKSANSFSYTPLTDLSYGSHDVTVIVKGKDATSDKGTLTEKWTFTIDNKLPGTSNTATTVVTNKIKLPIIGIEVDQWLGTVIIGLFVLLLFGILIIAVIALIRILRNKDDDMQQISKYYQQEPVAPIVTSNVNSGMTPEPFTPSVSQPINTNENISTSLPEPQFVESAPLAPENNSFSHVDPVVPVSEPINPIPETIAQPVSNDVLSNDLSAENTGVVNNEVYTTAPQEEVVNKNPEPVTTTENISDTSHSGTYNEPYDPFK